ncbi:3-hydroxybutyryl-CoA dehydrogenase [Candidatus Desantisbacteria bacterium CG1_02_38_46]|uniref:3-hydroxybutyryl-CoA dehydrogenase n=3 Tax=unclassified Candidatus Desantisiibacteriota TaxID=3106372 RepID=A0A2H9PAF7_9BACT|nr:MAG: 3-hydroxybutyryl-CoA dehydrogenase [Candidatus Desantisbacteria bacterium CG1_02_38_46]PIU50718.1 MAG: 3-hydroxybutyryl-CoA dehydrogenase [Candidatus Desantisbacteria bacterium CG07_land_8_20_14_0_80_39_15]PIZ15374.1 MAG: 3-hydroxybutyryl-CoA dehydrogenase [Candidatus Desantisbacteria bacterium CG_4_10_14_0_8_um_filter_39_17]
MKKIMVVGAGIMGQGISLVFARKGLSVIIQDIADEQVKKGLQDIEKNLDKEINKGDISLKEKELILKGITGTTELKEAKNVDFVIEAVTEDIKIKKEIFRNLDKFCPPDVIFASNTSSLSITEIAQVVSRKDKVIGMHFFNPPTKMELIEIVCGKDTAKQTFQTVKRLSEILGKKIVKVKDSPGFIVNRLLIQMINESCFLLQDGVANPEEIDLAMQLGARHPLGPLGLADLIGLDVCLSIMETFYQKFQDSKYKPCPLLKEMVEKGKKGRKTGEGFFKYGTDCR